MPLIIIDLRSLSVAFNSVEVDWTLAGQPEEDFERHWLWQRTVSSWRFQKIVCNNCDAARCQDMSRLHNRHVGQALWLDGPRSPPLNVRRKRWMSNGGLSHDVTDFRAPWQALYRGTTGSPLDPIAAIAILWCWLKFDRLMSFFLAGQSHGSHGRAAEGVHSLAVQWAFRFGRSRHGDGEWSAKHALWAIGFRPYQAALETDFWYHSLGRFHCDAERVQSGDRMQPDDAGGEPWPQRSLCVEHQR